MSSCQPPKRNRRARVAGGRAPRRSAAQDIAHAREQFRGNSRVSRDSRPRPSRAPTMRSTSSARRARMINGTSLAARSVRQSRSRLRRRHARRAPRGRCARARARAACRRRCWPWSRDSRGVPGAGERRARLAILVDDQYVFVVLPCVGLPSVIATSGAKEFHPTQAVTFR